MTAKSTSLHLFITQIYTEVLKHACVVLWKQNVSDNGRTYKQFQVDQFRADITAAPFHVDRVFEDNDDVLWAWNKLFKDICDLQAPTKRVKIRSKSSPWINNDIRRKMNLSCLRKLLALKIKKFMQDTRNLDWNEITCEIRNAKAQYFKEKLAKVKSAAAYWNSIAEAINPVRRNRIGPLKREDGSLAVNDVEKANLINDFFANLGTRLGRVNRNFAQQSDRIGCSVSSVTDITVCEDPVRRRLKAIKANKTVGPDDIPPKLWKLAQPAIVSPLACLFSFCVHLGETFNLLFGRKLVWFRCIGNLMKLTQITIDRYRFLVFQAR